MHVHLQLHVHLHLHLHLHLHGQMSALPTLLYAAVAVWQFGSGARVLIIYLFLRLVSRQGSVLWAVGFLLFMVDVPGVMLLSRGTVEGCG